MITIGTDPEFFLADANNNPIAVCGKLGGTKGAALDIGEGFAVQEDNVMVEWNIEPCRSAEEFADRMVSGFERVSNFVRTRVPDSHAVLAPLMEFPKAQLSSPQAMQFGCAPDFDAYGRGAPCPVLDPAQFSTKKGAYRFAGGHVHIGFNNPNSIPEFVIAALADVWIGLLSVELGDAQGMRREHYGRPGRYRPTPYGIEYRVLSNFWTGGSWELAHNIAHGAFRLGRAIERADVAEIQRLYKNTDWNGVRGAIVSEDPYTATRLRNYVDREFDMGGDVA